MEKNKQDYDIARILKNELNKRNNPTDLKSIHIGTVVNVEPVEVSRLGIPAQQYIMQFFAPNIKSSVTFSQIDC